MQVQKIQSLVVISPGHIVKYAVMDTSGFPTEIGGIFNKAKTPLGDDETEMACVTYQNAHPGNIILNVHFRFNKLSRSWEMFKGTKRQKAIRGLSDGPEEDWAFSVFRRGESPDFVKFKDVTNNGETRRVQLSEELEDWLFTPPQNYRREDKDIGSSCYKDGEVDNIYSMIRYCRTIALLAPTNRKFATMIAERARYTSSTWLHFNPIDCEDFPTRLDDLSPLRHKRMPPHEIVKEYLWWVLIYPCGYHEVKEYCNEEIPLDVEKVIKIAFITVEENPIVSWNYWRRITKPTIIGE